MVVSQRSIVLENATIQNNSVRVRVPKLKIEGYDEKYEAARKRKR
jgi:hypothetical protein